ncbi:MAG: bacteriophage abortive infection AbiH family protein [Intestinimonas sp.]|jgi:hypothetical protein
MLSRLVVIGNGFDLAHGLHTKYSDFMKYLCSYEKPPQIIYDRFVLLDSVSAQDQERHRFYEAIGKYIPEEDLWSSFEEALGFLDYEQIQEDNSCYFLDYGDDNWRDSANHDFQYMISEDLSFATNISRYFSEWILHINTNVPPVVSPDILNRNCLFLNFNYTDTLEKVYGIPTSNILYIHGNALRGNNLILGHHNAALFQEQVIPAFNAAEEHGIYLEDIEEDFRLQEAKEIIKDYFRRTYKDTASIIRYYQSFFNSLRTVNEVYVLGHSLSEIDFDYFAEIRKNVQSTCKWCVSYHDDSANAQNLIDRLNIKNSQLFYF